MVLSAQGKIMTWILTNAPISEVIFKKNGFRRGKILCMKEC